MLNLNPDSTMAAPPKSFWRGFLVFSGDGDDVSTILASFEAKFVTKQQDVSHLLDPVVGADWMPARGMRLLSELLNRSG